MDRLHGSFPKFGIDGRRPKVKANIRAKLANKGKKAFFQKFDKPTKKSGRKVNLDHHRKNRIEFVEPIVEEETDFQFSGKDLPVQCRAAAVYLNKTVQCHGGHGKDKSPVVCRRSTKTIGTSTSPIKTESFIPGPELRPDGRAPRVKSDIFAEQPNVRTEPELTTIQSFIDEPFFASPSSPKPFIFRGTPDPYTEQDLFGSASTVEPFFPTVKSSAESFQGTFSLIS